MSDESHVQYTPRRVDTLDEDQDDNERKNSIITNRRHSIAHINFRKAIYRSLSLPQVNDECTNPFLQCLIYFIKFFFLCLFLLLVGSLIRLMFSFHRRK